MHKNINLSMFLLILIFMLFINSCYIKINNEFKINETKKIINNEKINNDEN